MDRWPTIIAVAGLAMLLAGTDSARADRTCFALESQVFQLQAGGIDRGEARRMQMLRQRMARAGCGRGGRGARSANVDPEPRRQRSMSRRTAPRSHALRRPAERAPQSKPKPRSSGTYRTMCVRSCDGYYFPVSFSTTREHFSDDSETCARLCPGASAELYTHSVPDEVPAEMVSLDGAPYSELPTAFRYRKSLDQSCTCGRPLAEEPADNGGGQETGETQSRLSALPRPRPAPAQDPETVANRMGGFVATEVEPAAFASAQGRFGKPVRNVGPANMVGQTSELLVRPVRE